MQNGGFDLLIASRQCAIMPPDLISAIITGTIEASKSLVRVSTTRQQLRAR